MATPHRNLVTKLLIMVAGMFAFGYALVPLYNAFCALTGLNGKVTKAATAVVEAPDTDRTVRMEFVTSVAPGVPFEFGPDVHHLDIHPGELYTALFHARNELDEPVTAQAVPSVAPGVAAAYLKKVSCFCFSPQPFAAGEARELPVVFLIKPDFPKEYDVMTLSYTLYRAPSGAAGS